MAYLADTLTAESRKTYDATETVKWAKAAKWEKLEIISTDKGREDDTDGHVEFKAYYTMNGSKQIHHEHATFNKEDGAWKYAEGHFTHKAEPRIVPTKIGRNDPCMWGSGKKYKKCCGA
jgi:SEC-C motif-containing protein